MPFSLPADFDLAQGVAIALLFGSWFSYSTILRLFARGSLNQQLSTVRVRWLNNATTRAQRPFDAILLGQIVHSIAFFGSATMIVLAGVITVLASVQSIHGTVSELHITSASSLDLFVIHIGVLNVILALSFFSFTYALRKLIYVIALMGALPDGQTSDAQAPGLPEMVNGAATVLTEALKTFNFGIRGYYYFIASLGLFVSPYACLLLTFIATATLLYRQLATKTARAIQGYVEAADLNKER